MTALYEATYPRRAHSQLPGVGRYTVAMSRPDSAILPVSLDPSPTIDAYKAGVDRTLLRENLKLTTTQRVEKMMAALRFAEAVRRSQVAERP
jgi:hypothetical protein